MLSHAGRIRMEVPLTDKCTHTGTGGARNWVCGDGSVLIGPRGAGLEAVSEEEERISLSQHRQQLWKVLISDFHNHQSEEVLLNWCNLPSVGCKYTSSSSSWNNKMKQSVFNKDEYNWKQYIWRLYITHLFGVKYFCCNKSIQSVSKCTCPSFGSK